MERTNWDRYPTFTKDEHRKQVFVDKPLHPIMSHEGNVRTVSLCSVAAENPIQNKPPRSNSLSYNLVSTNLFSTRETQTQDKQSKPPIYRDQADCCSTRMWVVFKGQCGWIVEEHCHERERREEKQQKNQYAPCEGVACKRGRCGYGENPTGMTISWTWKRKKLRLDISVRKDQKHVQLPSLSMNPIVTTIGSGE